MDIAIVLLIVKNDMIVEHHSLTVLTVLVSLLDEESHSLSTWIRCQFKTLTFPINYGWFLSVLNVHSWVHMLKLDRCTICYFFALQLLDPPIVVIVLLLDSLVKHPKLIFNEQNLLRTDLLLCCFVSTFKLLLHFSVFHRFGFPPVLSHRIISKLGHDLEDHVSNIAHLRWMQFLTLLDK